MNLKSFKERYFRHFSWSIVLPVLFLLIIGLITLYSTTILPEGGVGSLSIVKKQVISIIVGIFAFIIFSYINISYLKHWQFVLIIYLVTVGLLVATLLFAPTIANVKRWLTIAGFQLQPSEIAKLCVIITTSVALSYKEKYNEFFLFIITLILIFPIVILIYMQPSGSIMILTLIIWFIIVFFGLNNPLRNSMILVIISSITLSLLMSAITGNNMWYLLLSVAIIPAVFGFYSKNNWQQFMIASLLIGIFLGIFAQVVWKNILKDYQKKRIEAFLSPEETKTDIGFNVNQARIAIGSGQILGKGFGNGTQSKRNFLPEYQTDFIFASFAEEFGLIGSIFLIGVYCWLIIICLLTAVKTANNTMLSLMSAGLGVKLLLEVFVNIGTNMGTIPATGIPLPLMSAGGTSVIITMVGFGILQNIYICSTNKLRTEKKDILKVYED